MSSTVYFADLTAKSDKDGILAKTAGLFEALYKDNPFFKPKDIVGIKAHFGEIGLSTFLSPVFGRTIVDKIKEKEGNPFLFDTCTLYANGHRINAVEHVTTAIKNGFSYATIGAPVIVADGLVSENEIEIETDAKHTKKIKIAAAIKHMDAIICLSHFKGHCCTGFGGTLKTLSMGMATRAGKLEMHSQSKPFVINKCTGCGICITICPAGAIHIKDGKAYINPDTCIGCMRCHIKCPSGAIKFNWDNPGNILMEKMAEYAYGVSKIKKGKIAYMNFMLEITPDCDCYGFSNAPVTKDIGVLASFDPLAIDQASIDMVNKTTGKDIFRKIWPNVDYEILLDYAEKLGIGGRKYNLVKYQ